MTSYNQGKWASGNEKTWPSNTRDDQRPYKASKKDWEQSTEREQSWDNRHYSGRDTWTTTEQPTTGSRKNDKQWDNSWNEGDAWDGNQSQWYTSTSWDGWEQQREGSNTRQEPSSSSTQEIERGEQQEEGMGHLGSWVPDGIFKGLRSPKNKYSGSLQ